jgi:beta-galactosidase
MGDWRGDHNARAVAGLLDMQGYNYAPYSGDYDADHSSNPGWAIFGSEVSSFVASRGFYITPAQDVIRVRDVSEVGITHNYGSDYDNFCMTYGNTAMEGYLYDIERPYSQGVYIWSGFDYIGEPRPFSWPSKNAYYGAIDTAGFFKNVAYFYQSRWFMCCPTGTGSKARSWTYSCTPTATAPSCS